MARHRTWSQSRPAAVIWLISIFLFYTLLQLGFRYSSNNMDPSSSSDIPVSNTERRARLYDKMARDLDDRGAAFLNHGETSQSLSISDLFTLQDGSVRPILKQSCAGKVEIEHEAVAIKSVADSACPLRIVLDRVVLTSTGVLLGCWQVTSGTDPILIRAKLRAALPRAPEKQLYDAAILHTSLARLLGPPKSSSTGLRQTSDQLQFFHELVDRLNNKIHGFEASVSELWFVEEYDVLALAVDGRMKARRFHLGCKDHS